MKRGVISSGGWDDASRNVVKAGGSPRQSVARGSALVRPHVHPDTFASVVVHRKRVGFPSLAASGPP